MEHAAVTRDAVIARNVSPRKRGTLSNPRFRLVPMLHISTFPTSANDSKPWSVNLQRLVDASLRVIVHQAARTLLAFRPAHLHGTTSSLGARNTIISISFSQRVSDAWAAASELEKASIISAAGAGHGYGE